MVRLILFCPFFFAPLAEERVDEWSVKLPPRTLPRK
jgi:hypothetical protein